MSLADLYRVLDQLIERFASGADPGALQAARTGYEKRRGRVFEDEELWEEMSRGFVEWYVLEGSGGAPPAVAALGEGGDDPRIRAWLCSHRSLFRVESARERVVELSDLLGGAAFRVSEPRTFQGAERGDVLEARLVGEAGMVYFGRSFLFHPPGTEKAILAHAERLREQGASRLEAVDGVARLRVQCERFRHVPPKRVYESGGQLPR